MKSRTSTWSLDSSIFEEYLPLSLWRADLKLNHILEVSFIATTNILVSKLVRFARMHIILIGGCNEQSFNAWVRIIVLRYPCWQIC